VFFILNAYVDLVLVLKCEQFFLLLANQDANNFTRYTEFDFVHILELRNSSVQFGGEFSLDALQLFNILEVVKIELQELSSLFNARFSSLHEDTASIIIQFTSLQFLTSFALGEQLMAFFSLNPIVQEFGKRQVNALGIFLFAA